MFTNPRWWTPLLELERSAPEPEAPARPQAPEPEPEPEVRRLREPTPKERETELRERGGAADKEVSMKHRILQEQMHNALFAMGDLLGGAEPLLVAVFKFLCRHSALRQPGLRRTSEFFLEGEAALPSYIEKEKHPLLFFLQPKDLLLRACHCTRVEGHGVAQRTSLCGEVWRHAPHAGGSHIRAPHSLG